MKFDRYSFENVYTADFEATTNEPITGYMWSYCNVYNDADCYVSKGLDSVKQFLEWLQTLPNKAMVYFFNMHYDWALIRSWCFFNCTEKCVPKFEDFIHPSSKKIIESKLTFKDRIIYLRDQYCLFNQPLKNVMRDYTPLQKGDTPIYKNVQDIRYLKEHMDYCMNDSVGAAVALHKRLEIGGHKKTTAAGAMYEFKEILKKKSKYLFKKLFPELSLNDDTSIRKSYQGGFCYVKPDIAGVKITTPVEVIDCNSIYPYCMTKDMPYGRPLAVEGEVKPRGKYKLGMQTFTVGNAVLIEGKIPFITTGGCSRFGAKNYNEVISDCEPEAKRTFTLTLQEFELFKETYDYDKITLKGGWLFKASNKIFLEYIEKMREMKYSKVQSIKSNGKLFLNSLYGKFGENPKKKPCHVEFVEGILKIKEGDEETGKGGYIPVASFITSYARLHLIKNIYKIGYENFLYCDTDSIHMLKTDNIKKIDIDPNRFGAWKNETADSIIVECNYLRTKRYVHKYANGKIKFTCAGIKKEDLENQIKTVDEFKIGTIIKTVKGFMGYGGITFKETEVRI